MLALGAAACAGGTHPPPASDASGLRPGTLRVRLEFGAEADLDLYVTGPSLETIYFANPLVQAGELDADRRCGDPAPRVETVTFEQALAGPYRVGIDFPERCRPGSGPVGYRLVFEGPGVREERSGQLELGRFEARSLEIEIAP